MFGFLCSRCQRMQALTVLHHYYSMQKLTQRKISLVSHQLLSLETAFGLYMRVIIIVRHPFLEVDKPCYLYGQDILHTQSCCQHYGINQACRVLCSRCCSSSSSCCSPGCYRHHRPADASGMGSRTFPSQSQAISQDFTAQQS